MNFIGRLLDRALWFPNHPMGRITIMVWGSALLDVVIQFALYSCAIVVLGPFGFVVIGADILLWWWRR